MCLSPDFSGHLEMYCIAGVHSDRVRCHSRWKKTWMHCELIPQSFYSIQIQTIPKSIVHHVYESSLMPLIISWAKFFWVSIFISNVAGLIKNIPAKLWSKSHKNMERSFFRYWTLITGQTAPKPQMFIFMGPGVPGLIYRDNSSGKLLSFGVKRTVQSLGLSDKMKFRTQS